MHMINNSWIALAGHELTHALNVRTLQIAKVVALDGSRQPIELMSLLLTWDHAQLIINRLPLLITTHELVPVNEHVNRCGYVTVSINGTMESKHRLIAETLIPNPDDLPEVDHIDGNPLNNSIDNLRWVSRSENCRNRRRPHRQPRQYVDIDEDELVPVIHPKFTLRPNTYFFSPAHDAVVKMDRCGQWFSLSVHQRGGYERVNMIDEKGRGRMVTLDHLELDV